jgi:hypothetical protein
LSIPMARIERLPGYDHDLYFYFLIYHQSRPCPT